MTGAPRVLVVTDSDSYVKWGAALAGRLPAGWPVRLVVARGNARPSPRQLGEALAGTRFGVDQAMWVGRPELEQQLSSWRPDVVVAAARGMTVQAILEMVDDAPDRPVLVSGLAGISIPVLAPGLRLRHGVDVFVVHSRRELREFTATSTAIGVPHRFELATLPYLSTSPMTVRPHEEPEPVPTRDRIVFAAQAMVPATRRDRAWLLDLLVETARTHPHLLVVVKVRARGGEPQTHVEELSYDDLLLELIETGRRPPVNLVVDSGPMAWHLRRAVGFATISSSAILEAIAEAVPSVAIDDFGVGAEQINLVLADSGLVASADSLVRGELAHPDPAWLDDNYFHDPADDSWIAAVEQLLETRRSSGLPAVARPARRVRLGVQSTVYGRLAFTSDTQPFSRALHRVFLTAGFWEHRRRWAVRARSRRPAGASAPTTGTRP